MLRTKWAVLDRNATEGGAQVQYVYSLVNGDTTKPCQAGLSKAAAITYSMGHDSSQVCDWCNAREGKKAICQDEPE